jgi:predicted MFS family arabinose efflux permease
MLRRSSSVEADGADRPDAEAGPSQVRVVSAACLSVVVGIVPVFLLGALAILVRADLQFSETQLGLATSAFFAAAALTSVPAGHIAHRLGHAATTSLAAVVSASAMVVMATAQSYPVLVAALVVGGGASAMATIGSNDALARSVSVRRQGLAFGAKQAAVPAATLLAGLAVPLVGLTLGWRAAFGVAATLAIGYLLLQPRGRRRPAGRRRAPDRTGDAALGALMVVALAAGVGAAAANALGAFLVESSVRAGLTASSAGLLLAGSSALGVLLRIYLGWRADIRSAGQLGLVTAMLAVGAGGVALLATGAVPAMIAGAVLAVGLGWSWPGLLNLAVVRLSPSAPALGTSITQTGVFAGGAAGPVSFGVLVESSSYATAWTTTAVALLVAAVLMVVGGRLVRSPRSPAAP